MTSGRKGKQANVKHRNAVIRGINDTIKNYGILVKCRFLGSAKNMEKMAIKINTSTTNPSIDIRHDQTMIDAVVTVA